MSQPTITPAIRAWGGDPNAWSVPRTLQKFIDQVEDNAALFYELLGYHIARLQQERETAHNQAAAISGLEEEARSLRLQLQESRTAPAPREPRSEKMPDPPKFDGTRERLRPFITQLRLKFIANGDRFPEPQTRLAYAVCLLSGPALDRVLPLVRGDRVDLTDVEALITLLETAFGDPDRVATAERELGRLSQGSMDFPSYYAEFQRWAADVGWNDEAKKDCLTDGLSHDLRAAILVHHTTPTTLPDYVLLLRQLDSRIRNLRARDRHSTTPTRASAPAHPSLTPAAGGVVAPMDLSINNNVVRRAHPRRGPLSAAERSRRAAQGLCMYCGGHGHYAQECPARPARIAAVEISDAATGHYSPTGNEDSLI